MSVRIGDSSEITKLYALDPYNSFCLIFDNFSADTVKNLAKKKTSYDETIQHINKINSISINPTDYFCTLAEENDVDNIIYSACYVYELHFTFGITYSNLLYKQKPNYMVPFIKIHNEYEEHLAVTIRISLIDIKGQLTEGCFVEFNNVSGDQEYMYCFDYLNLDDVDKYIQLDGSIKMVFTFIYAISDHDNGDTKINSGMIYNTLHRHVCTELKAYSQYVEELNSEQNDNKLELVYEKIKNIDISKITDDDVNAIKHMSLTELANLRPKIKIIHDIIENIEYTKMTQLCDESDTRKLLCNICQDNIIDTVFTPCGHFVSCKDCADKLFTIKLSSDDSDDDDDYDDIIRECPICKHNIENVQRVFMS